VKSMTATSPPQPPRDIEVIVTSLFLCTFPPHLFVRYEMIPSTASDLLSDFVPSSRISTVCFPSDRFRLSSVVELSQFPLETRRQSRGQVKLQISGSMPIRPPKSYTESSKIILPAQLQYSLRKYRRSTIWLSELQGGVLPCQHDKLQFLFQA
jgi:hypothetical protein